MEPTGDTERDRVTSAVESRYPEIADPAVFGCWHVVVEAAHQGWLTADGRGSVERLIGTLVSGGALGVEEYEMAVDGNRVIVGFIDESYACSRPAMIKELRRLDEDLRGEPAPPVTNARPWWGVGLGADPADVRRVVDALSSANAVLRNGASGEGGRLRGEAAAALGRLRAVAQVDTGDPGRERGAVALRAFADWAENPSLAGARVDAVNQYFEDAVGQLLPGRRAEGGPASGNGADG